MRKGYALIEVIVVLSLFVLLGATFSQLWPTFISEIPRGYRLVQQHSTLNNLVSHIRADVADAGEISQLADDSLLIKMAYGTILYRYEPGRILRQKDDDSMVWSAPQGKVEWRIRNSNSIELTTYIEDNNLGSKQKKMANSFVFFTRSIREARK